MPPGAGGNARYLRERFPQPQPPEVLPDWEAVLPEQPQPPLWTVCPVEVWTKSEALGG